MSPLEPIPPLERVLVLLLMLTAGVDAIWVVVYAAGAEAVLLLLLTLPGLDRLRRGIIHVLRSRRKTRNFLLIPAALLYCMYLLMQWKHGAWRPTCGDDDHACILSDHIHDMLLFYAWRSLLSILLAVTFHVDLHTMEQQRVDHLGYQESVPFTKRTRSIIFSPESDRKLVEPLFAKFKVLHASCILPPEHPASDRVRTITSEIVRAARTAQPQTSNLLRGWEVIVVRDASRVNAMCLPGGKIIVFTGLLDSFAADADVATVLCHEVGHAIARHTAERKTRKFWLFIWEAVMLARGLGVCTKLCDYFFTLPLSRRTELEADYIGLLLLAAAGYDPRAAPSFYEKLGKIGGDPGWSSYRSTHPSSKKRVQLLSQPHVMKKALELYKKNL